MVLIYFALFVLMGCKTNTSELLTLSFDVSEDLSVPISAIADKIEVVELETKEAAFIKDVRQVEMFENCLIVRDLFSALYVFDLNGKFLRTIGKAGNGPGEYKYCFSFTLDFKNKIILLNTNIGIMAYDISGNFIDMYPIRDIKNIFYYESHFYALNYKYTKEEKYYQDTYFSVFDSSWNGVDSVLFRRNITEEFTVAATGVQTSLFRNGKDIHVYEPTFQLTTRRDRDTLYTYTEGEINPFAAIHLSNSQENSINGIIISGRYFIITYITYIEQPQTPIKLVTSSQCIYDIKNQKGMNTKNGFVDDICGKDRLIISPMLRQGIFYAVSENEYSEEYKMELNPTIYIGTFKK